MLTILYPLIELPFHTGTETTSLQAYINNQWNKKNTITWNEITWNIKRINSVVCNVFQINHTGQQTVEMNYSCNKNNNYCC